MTIYLKIILLSLITSGSLMASGAPANTALGCPSDDPKTPTFDRKASAAEDIRERWGEDHFTDPKHHNPRHFKYILHAINYMHTPRSSF